MELEFNTGMSTRVSVCRAFLCSHSMEGCSSEPTPTASLGDSTVHVLWPVIESVEKQKWPLNVMNFLVISPEVHLVMFSC